MMSARMFNKNKLLFLIICALMLLFVSPCWGQSYGSMNNQQTFKQKEMRGNGRTPGKKYSKKQRVHKNKSPGHRQHRMQNEKKWEKLSPQKRQELHHRMDRFKSMPQEDRRLYQKRFEQLQQLPPDERNDLRNKLRRMDRLSPQEKEEIRRKFE